MNSSMIGGLVAVAAVVIVALVMRAMGGGERGEGSVRALPPDPASPGARPEPPDEDADDTDDADDADDDGTDDRLVVAVTSDGRAFVPDHHVVRVLSTPEEGEEWKVGARLKAALETVAMGSGWSPGDLRGARVVRGDFDEGPWLLETLGRDGEYITYVFETSEAANAAKGLLERLDVVVLGEDEDGRPMPPSAEQFAEARRIYLETAAQLELPDEESGAPQEGAP
jgi:hypothetical protein